MTNAAQRSDLRPAAERRLRSAWRSGPGPGLRLAAGLYAVVTEIRNVAYDAGLATPVRAELPVLSVGAIAVGGSGKTPVAARAARWARADGATPAVVTHGFRDELALHRRLNPDVPALGGRDRSRRVPGLRRRGVDLAILDDGYQHRRLARDLDWVVLDEDRVRGGSWRLLPAGPGRERWGRLQRADALILCRRVNRSRAAVPVRTSRLATQLERSFPAAVVARCELRPGPLVAANGRAREVRRPRPRVAFASVMKGRDFLQALRERQPEVEREYLFPDHHRPGEDRLREILGAAGERGLVGTGKDVAKVVERVEEETPLWYVPEECDWTRGADRLRRQLADIGSGGAR